MKYQNMDLPNERGQSHNYSASPKPPHLSRRYAEQFAVEDAAPSPPYGLVTAAASLHWMDWDVVLPRFAEILSPNGLLTIIEDKVEPIPCPEALWSLVRCCSTNQEYQPKEQFPADTETRHAEILQQIIAMDAQGYVTKHV